MIEIKTLKEIKIDITRINNDDIELIKGGNTSVEKLIVNWENDVNNHHAGDLYAYFINGLRISKISFRDSVNKSKKIKINLLIEKEKESFKQALNLFKNNNTMKAYCFYPLGNLEYELKNFGEAEKCYKEGVWCKYYYHVAVTPTFKE